MDALCARFPERNATIGIIGLGYVGLPLTRTVLSAGFRVIGVDVDASKIASLKAGRSYIRDLNADLFRTSIEEGKFEPTTDFSALAKAQAIVMCVPTPLTSAGEPDLSYVAGTSRSILPHLRQGQLVVLESTTYPGTTREMVKPILQESGLISGRDFFLAYSPERVDPGSIGFSSSQIPKVVGGDGEDALRLARAFYDQLAPRTVPVSSLEAAEATKLLENVYRAVNIALINELKVIYSGLGIDIWEVIEAAKTKPFGFMPFYPGPGLGGHCIPIDPFYLSWKARQHDLSARFIELAGQVNTEMPNYVVARVAGELKKRFDRDLNDCRALILGIAYKKNVDDTRESASLKLMHLFEERGAKVDYHDAYVPVIPRTRSYPRLAERRAVALRPESVAAYDFVVIATDHDDIDYQMIASHATLIVDTRNACEQRGIRGENIFKV